MFMDDLTADFLRITYAVLAIIVATGFVATLVIRWEYLHRGEKIVRVGLIMEHTVIVYGGYTALDLNYPPTAVPLAATIALAVTSIGFVAWIADLVLNPSKAHMNRMTDK